MVVVVVVAKLVDDVGLDVVDIDSFTSGSDDKVDDGDGGGEAG